MRIFAAGHKIRIKPVKAAAGVASPGGCFGSDPDDYRVEVNVQLRSLTAENRPAASDQNVPFGEPTLSSASGTRRMPPAAQGLDRAAAAFLLQPAAPAPERGAGGTARGGTVGGTTDKSRQPLDRVSAVQLLRPVTLGSDD
jgi:hypothetical protein